MRVPLVVALLLPLAAHATSSLTLAGASGAGQLALDGEGSSTSHIVKVASLTMDTDGPGFTLSISSGSLSKADGGTPIPFQVALVDEGAAPPPAAAFTVPSGSRYPFSTMTPGAVHKDLYIMYQSASLQDPGAYAARIDCDISDN